jgi:hypothetical protein
MKQMEAEQKTTPVNDPACNNSHRAGRLFAVEILQ